MGTVYDVEICFYDQDEQKYTVVMHTVVTFNEPLKVASCVGTISRLANETFAHTYAVRFWRDCKTFAGHLEATTVWAGEVYLRAHEVPLVRTPHDLTRFAL